MADPARAGGACVPPVIAESSDVRKLPDLDDEALDEPPPPTPSDTADAFAEFEDEIEGETTRIDDSVLLAEASTSIIDSAPAQPFLYVERGKDEGREFVLQEGDNAVGRGIDNDVILADVAVSRRHLIVVRDGELLKLKDLGSGNGTILNGKKLSSAALVEGDRLEVGETTLVVRQPGASLGAVDPYGDGQELPDEATVAEAPAAAFDDTPATLTSAPPSMASMTHPAVRAGGVRAGSVVIPRPVFVAIIAGGALLLTMFGAAVAVLALRGGGDDAEAQSHFELGRAAYHDRQYAEASRELELAVAAGEENEDLEHYASEARRAAEDERRLVQAEGLLAEHPERSLNLAQQTEPSSPLHSRAQSVIVQAQTAQVTALDTQFEAAAERFDLEAMRQAYEQARRINRSDERVTGMSQRLNELDPESGAVAPPEEEAAPEPEPEADAPTVEEPAPAAVAEAETEPTPEPAGRRGRRSRRARGVDVQAVQARAIGQYNNRQFSQASAGLRAAARRARPAERQRLTALAGRIDRFAGLWRQIQRANYSSRVTSQMSQAIGLDRNIARNSRFRSALQRNLVQAHLSAARGARDPVRRCGAVRSALRVNSSHAEARRMSAQCVSQAQRMMTQARGQRGTAAINSYRRVLQMVPPGSPLANSANQRIRELSSRHMRDEDE